MSESDFKKPFWVQITRHQARFAVEVEVCHNDDAPAWFRVCLGEEEFFFDDDDDLLDFSDEGTSVRVDYGLIQVTCWRPQQGRVWARASCTIGEDTFETEDISHGIEHALMTLKTMIPDDQVPHYCLYCAHSDYEPSTGLRHGLACFLQNAERYAEIAVSHDHRTRKWAMWGEYLQHIWVDEFHSCGSWKLRPHGYGYRG